GQSSGDGVAAILDREPALLARIEPDAPPELHRIVGKTLRKDRDQRYQVMKDLQLDLEALRDDVAVRARSSKWEPELPPIGTPTRVPDPDSATMAPLSSSKYLVAQVARHEVATAFAVLLFTSIAALMWWLGGSRAARTDAQGATSVQRTLTPMTFDEGLQAEPTWSPDGRFIAYSSNRSGNFDIWVQSVGGGDAVQITKSPAHDWQPDWSPDGSQIVFRSEREGGGLFVAPSLGGRERKVSPFGYRPRLSPDGTKILFSDQMYNTAYFIPNFPKLHVVTPDGNP